MREVREQQHLYKKKTKKTEGKQLWTFGQTRLLHPRMGKFFWEEGGFETLFKKKKIFLQGAVGFRNRARALVNLLGGKEIVFLGN